MHGHELLKPLLQRTHMISLARGEDRVGRRAVTALGLVEHGLQLGFLVARALQIRCQCAPLALDLLYVPLVLLLRAQQLLTRAVRLHPPLLLEPCFLAFAEKLGRLRRELELGCHLLDLLHRHAHIARGRRGRSHRTLHGASCCGSRQRCHWWRRWRRVVHAWGHRGRAGARCAHFVALIDVRVKPLVVLLELLNMQPQLLALELGFLSQVSELLLHLEHLIHQLGLLPLQLFHFLPMHLTVPFRLSHQLACLREQLLFVHHHGRQVFHLPLAPR
mmetsp:Transcript_86410/g.244049  ORF Transcript_86410/g.244049 Transcript_86410/m.244049 type:complete len:275 (-) Transcript_86410:1226-2050(-)